MTDLTPQAFEQARWLEDGWVGPEHFLLALLAEASVATEALGDVGVTYDEFLSPQDLLEALRRRGVRVPEVEPPAYRPWRGHHRIEVTEAELQPVIDVLTRRHPPASAWRWGFNWLPGQPRLARVDAEEGIDLDAILAKVRARASS